MILKHQTGLKRLKLRELNEPLRLAFFTFKQSIATQKSPWGRTQPAPTAYLKKPHMHQSCRAHLFCDPPRRMATSVHGTSEKGRSCKQEACSSTLTAGKPIENYSSSVDPFWERFSMSFNLCLLAECMGWILASSSTGGANSRWKHAKRTTNLQKYFQGPSSPN